MNRPSLPWLRPLVALAAGALFAIPLYIALINVFKHSRQVSADTMAPPAPPTLDNLVRVLTGPDSLFWSSLRTSVLVTSLSIVVLTTLSALLGHYLARHGGWWPRLIMVLLLCGLMIPPQVILIPVTQVLKALGLMSTIQGLVLFDIGYYVPFGVFVFSGFMKGVPRELEEAAAIDGATRWQTFWRIVFPLLRPATASVLIFLGVWIWNDFLNPLIIYGPRDGTTIMTGVYKSLGQYAADFGGMFALMFLATLPILTFYLLLQKHFVKGLTGGATKG
ncbi:carbohydrate ABC transporter permease [Nonomuraea roseoviolacea]|uniref:Raffinose/stachyose/melibiose transport system permease protein n=1 Tax=Nonomuraea roseoviolacea subsp. carminata TaxID=160689 RepID=A0ABT1JQF8_9ACTN|nr:carbohydrate ABC transporter permease [Nonomuraea roseoviolacea]MCP2343958.1 raffinose/stachyose/melibiose transport system permease protein [Nonomuraea roseoviolacea subsp. carminata]